MRNECILSNKAPCLSLVLWCIKVSQLFLLLFLTVKYIHIHLHIHVHIHMQWNFIVFFFTFPFQPSFCNPSPQQAPPIFLSCFLWDPLLTTGVACVRVNERSFTGEGTTYMATPLKKRNPLSQPSLTSNLSSVICFIMRCYDMVRGDALVDPCWVIQWVYYKMKLIWGHGKGVKRKWKERKKEDKEEWKERGQRKRMIRNTWRGETEKEGERVREREKEAKQSFHSKPGLNLLLVGNCWAEPRTKANTQGGVEPHYPSFIWYKVVTGSILSGLVKIIKEEINV